MVSGGSPSIKTDEEGSPSDGLIGSGPFAEHQVRRIRGTDGLRTLYPKQSRVCMPASAKMADAQSQVRSPVVTQHRCISAVTSCHTHCECER